MDLHPLVDDVAANYEDTLRAPLEKVKGAGPMCSQVARLLVAKEISAMMSRRPTAAGIRERAAMQYRKLAEKPVALDLVQGGSLMATRQTRTGHRRGLFPTPAQQALPGRCASTLNLNRCTVLP